MKYAIKSVSIISYSPSYINQFKGIVGHIIPLHQPTILAKQPNGEFPSILWGFFPILLMLV